MRKKSNSCACQRCFWSRFELRLTNSRICSRVYTWLNLQPSEENLSLFNTVICFVTQDACKNTKRRNDNTFDSPDNNIVFRKLYICLNIIGKCTIWPSILVLAAYILERVKNPNESERTTSFTFYLESGVTKLSVLAFSRRKILGGLLGTLGRTLGLVAKEIERRRKKECLKGTTCGARGSGRTCVEHS